MNNKHALPMLPPATGLIDTHCHLDMSAYMDDLKEVLDDAAGNGIEHIITIGIDTASSQKAIELAMRFPGISATIGVHPHDVENLRDQDYEVLRSLHDRHSRHVVGYGEIGLDYVKKYSTPERQREHFHRQLLFSRELNLPVIIHNREADEDTLNILKSCGGEPWSGVMHCFSGDYNYARRVLDLGLHISIPGVVTFKNAAALHEVAKKIPLDRMLCETDGPFLAPHPYRGKRNVPSYLLFTALKIAELRGTGIDTIARQTTENAKKLFGLG